MKWWERSPKLLKREIAEMSIHSTAVLDEIEGQLLWTEDVQTDFGETYTISIVYPCDYPANPPKSYVVSPGIPGAQHIYNDGSLCLFPPEEAFSKKLKHAEHIRGLTCMWLFCYTVYRQTGEWPAPEHKH